MLSNRRLEEVMLNLIKYLISSGKVYYQYPQVYVGLIPVCIMVEHKKCSRHCFCPELVSTSVMEKIQVKELN